MRSATSQTCGMLWLIRMIDRPLSRSCLTMSSTMPDSLTPRAAVGSSRTTTLLPNAAARATATAWRWPPERVSTAWLMFWMVWMPRSCTDCPARFSMPFLSSIRSTEPERALATLLAGEVEVARDVERGDDGQLLVDRLDAGLAGVLRLLEVDRLPVQRDLAGVGDVGPGQALDQRRLAGTVVTDDRQHLAGVEVEVDPVEADDAAEGDDELAGREDRLLGVDVLLACGDAAVGDLERAGAHAFTFLIHWSMATATMTRMPVARTRHCWSTPIWESPNAKRLDDERTDEGADEATSATEEAGATDDDGGDAGQVGVREPRWGWPLRHVR